MSSPKFSVGEEIILQSETYPEANGEYVVIGITRLKDIAFRYNFNYNSSDGSNYHYELGGVFVELRDMEGNCSGLMCNHFSETSLRKKHKPSEFESYEALMNNLKIKEKA